MFGGVTKRGDVAVNDDVDEDDDGTDRVDSLDSLGVDRSEEEAE